MYFAGMYYAIVHRGCANCALSNYNITKGNMVKNRVGWKILLQN